MEVAAGRVLEVSAVETAVDDGLLIGGRIEEPGAGEEGGHHFVEVAGWVLARSSAVERVEVVHRGTVLQAQRPRRVRRDVLQAHGMEHTEVRPGFRLLVGTIGLPEAFELEVRVVLDDGRRGRLGSIRATRSMLRSSLRPALQPLMVTSLGRTGTTWLMAMLAEHPQVVAAKQHPHEMRAAQYWAHALGVLSRPGDAMRSADTEFQRHLSWVGRNPYFNNRAAHQSRLGGWLGRGHAEALGDFVKGTIDGWYGSLAADQGDAAAVRFAEKCTPNHLPPLLWELYPEAKEVFLVRDFRDMAASILAFDRQRGFVGFGRAADESDDAYVRRLGVHAEALLDAWRSRSERAHLVRYEDLVRDTREGLRALLDHVGLHDGSESVEAMIAGTGQETPAMARHRTSQSLEDSVGRWRREGDERLRRALDDAFGDTLAGFGYAD